MSQVMLPTVRVFISWKEVNMSNQDSLSPPEILLLNIDLLASHKAGGTSPSPGGSHPTRTPLH